MSAARAWRIEKQYGPYYFDGRLPCRPTKNKCGNVITRQTSCRIYFARTHANQREEIDNIDRIEWEYNETIEHIG